MSKGEIRRVLFLTSSAPRFAGDPTSPFILNMARDLGDLGWQVTILAPHASGLKHEEVLDGVRIIRFRYLWPESSQTLCYNGGAAVNLQHARIRALLIPFFVAAQFTAALSFVLRKRPAIIHSHWAIPQGVIGQLLAMVTRRPHVISVHGADLYGFRSRAMRWIKGWALGRCAHAIANSSSTRTEVKALCRPRAVSIIPTGTSPLSGSSIPEAGSAPAAKGRCANILFVGRLIAAKGVRYLIEALPAISTQQRTRLVVVGDGPERDALEALARRLNVHESVHFAGSVPHARIYDWYARADVFVGPSLDIPGEWTEAQGNTFVEALFARVPVVASNVGGIPDAIIHERTGLLVEQRNPEQIAQAVLRLLTEAPLASAVREAGYRHAVRHFSRTTNAARIAAVYESVLGQTGRTATGG